MSMNRRRQIRFTLEEQAAFLRGHRKAALATIGEGGFPPVVAMNFFAKEGAFYMTSYAKAQKVVNIRRNAKVGLMVEAGDKYSELQGVMVRGHCGHGAGSRRLIRAAERRPRHRAEAGSVENHPGEDHKLGSHQARRRLL